MLSPPGRRKCIPDLKNSITTWPNMALYSGFVFSKEWSQFADQIYCRLLFIDTGIHMRCKHDSFMESALSLLHLCKPTE